MARKPRTSKLAVNDTIKDGLESLVSGLGTDRDKMKSMRFATAIADKGQLDNAYRGDWLSRKTIDIPAFDSTREWRSWQAAKQDITVLEQAERGFNLQYKLRRAMILARLYGGAALILGINQGRPEDEVNLETLKKGDLKFVHVVSRHDVAAGQINFNVDSPYYGEPEYYTRKTGDVTKIHPSRVVRLIGAEYPDISTSDGWGDSVLQIVFDAVMAAGAVSQGIASMVTEADVDIIKVPNLTKNAKTAEYETRLQKRFQIAAVAKSMFHMLLLDKEEEWQRISHSFSQLPELLKTFLLIAAGAADIPLTRLLGDSASGLNATGENDIRNYYDKVKSEQQMILTPTLSRLDEVLIRSVLGSRPPEIFYEWRSLWQMTDAQKADLASKKATTFKTDVDAGVLDINVLRKARVNQLVEDGTYPGLEQIIEEQDAMEEEGLGSTDPAELDPEDPEGETLTGDSFSKRLISDARPRTLYVRRDVLNGADIVRWAKQNGFKTTLPANEMHVTIAYSRAPVDWAKAGEAFGQDDKGQLRVRPGGMRLVEKLGDATVLLISSSELSWRWWDLKERTGAEWDWPEYQPHVTISYEGAPADAESIKPYTGEIILGPEIFEEVKENFREGIVEDALAKRRGS